MEADYYEEYATLEENHWWFDARRQILQTLLREQPKPARILDAGAGAGAMSRWLRQWGDVVSVDCHSGVLARGGSLNPVCASIGRLPFRDASFDWVCAFDLLEHVQEDLASLKEMGRVCRPGGRILLTVPAFPSLWGNHDRANHHLRRYRAQDLARLSRAVDLRTLRMTHFNTFLFLPVAVTRLVARLASRPSNRSDFSRIRWLPSFLEAILRETFASERHLVRWVSLPVGLSLFAVLEP